MGKNYVKIFAAFVDCRGKTDNFGARAYDYQQFEFAILCKRDIFIITFQILILFNIFFRQVS